VQPFRILALIAGLSILFLLATCTGSSAGRVSHWQPGSTVEAPVTLSTPETADFRAAVLPTVGPGRADQVVATPEPITAVALPIATAAPAPGVGAAAVPPGVLDGVASTLSTPPIPAEPVGPGIPMHAYVQSLANAGQFSGAILVAQGDRVLLAEGYGMADYGAGIANTAETRFRLASLTKQFTAMAIMVLQAAGQLDINQSICEYLEDCPPAWRTVTVRNLLNHTSGIPNYTDFIDFETTETRPTTPEELIGRFRALPLNYEPGAFYHYGNSGYVLLGRIVEHVSGMSYGEFLQAAIFDKVGMPDSGVDPGAPGAVERALGYVVPGTPASPIDTSTLFAAGNLYSTVIDLYRWDRALETELLLPAHLRNELFMPGHGEYGYGWKITTRNGHRVIAHPGNMSGSATLIRRYPEDRLTLIILSNMEYANIYAIGDGIVAMVLE
jgi:CubicO group peptidase (beta-lactamase class C family)